MHMEYEERPSGRRRRRRGRGAGGGRVSERTRMHDQIMVSEALLRLPIKLVDDGWKALRQHHPHQPHPPTRPSDASGWVASRLMESRPACVQHNTVLPKRLPTACASRCRVEPRSSCAPRDRIRLARGGDVHEEAEAQRVEGGRKEGGAEEGKMLALATPLGNPKRSRSGGCARWHCFNTGTRGLPGTAAAPTGDVASKSFRQHIGHNGARPCARSSTCKTLLLPTTPRASSSAREASLNLDADPRPVGLLVDGGFLLAPAALLALVAHV
ncbi:unnamed protein product [Prorocentrum cordatum]|uniref:Uncharacterized protein n=2 Tax=Prorocentrum cordatum TaxID=2364126 RepID=A0ABN9SJS5_9DINO|nr:unnamed protein product [Polarella glacialis]